MLKLKEGWRSVTEGGVMYLYPPVPINVDTPDDEKEIVARPDGSSDFHVFNDINEAHAYLIESGSESPWEEV